MPAAGKALPRRSLGEKLDRHSAEDPEWATSRGTTSRGTTRPQKSEAEKGQREGFAQEWPSSGCWYLRPRSHSESKGTVIDSPGGQCPADGLCGTCGRCLSPGEKEPSPAAPGAVTVKCHLRSRKKEEQPRRMTGGALPRGRSGAGRSWRSGCRARPGPTGPRPLSAHGARVDAAAPTQPASPAWS